MAKWTCKLSRNAANSIFGCLSSTQPSFACAKSRAPRGWSYRTDGGRMASKLKIKVNGLVHNVTASLDTPLLYVLHNELHLHGPRFGCGLAQCGACSVLLDGKEIRSCVTPVAAVSGKAITTLEG